MVTSIYKKAFAVLRQKPVTLWGISLLCGLLELLAFIGFGAVPVGAFIVAWALEAGMAMIYLNSYRTGLKPKSTYLFAAFKKDRFWRVVGGLAWMELWIFLWALIPIVGIVFAVIRAYEYRFTPYILMTRDDVKATDAIKLSKQETMGYKGKMFWADMLIVLLYLAAALVLLILSLIPFIGVLFRVVNTLLSIAFSLFAPLFLGIVQAAFYVETKSAPAAPAQPTPPTIPAPVAPVAPTAPAAPEVPVTEAPAPVEEAPAEAPTEEVPAETPAEEAPAAPAEEAPAEAPTETAPAETPAEKAPAEVAPEAARARFCPTCGHEFAPADRFCQSCGTPVPNLP